MSRSFYTAAELAEFAKKAGLTSFPHTKRGVNKLVARDGWNSLPANLSRLRGGIEGGGGMEYHMQLLPEALQAVIASAKVKGALLARHDAEAERDRRQVAALRISTLGARARAVLEARSQVLTSIDGYVISRGMDRSWGIAQFLAAQDACDARQEIEARRDAGQILTEREAASLVRPLVLMASDGFALTPEVLVAANDRAGAKARISRSSLYDWFKSRDAGGVVALAPAATKEAQPVPPGFAGFLKYYAIGSKPSAPAALEKYNEAAPKGMQLTIDQVRHTLRVKLNNIEKNIGREGILTLRSRMPYIQRTTDDMWPTTVYTADGKTFDAEVADPVTRRPMRPEITSVLDVATRKCVGYAVSRKENVIAVSEALRRSCSSHGICAIFYTDRGTGYKNKTFDGDKTADAEIGGLMGRLGIAKMHALPYNSQAKGIIERFNAQWNDLAKTMPTYIGVDMDKEAGGRAHKQTRSDIKEFGVSNLLPTWDQFLSMCDRLIETYNDAPHRGLPRFEDPETGRLRHMSPNEAWSAHVAAGFEPVLIDPADEDDLFRPYELRTVRRGLVEWNTNQFFHPTLEVYHDHRVMVGYDLHQAERVWVREFDAASGQPGRLICVATFSGNKVRYIPKSYEEKALEGRIKGQLKRVDDKRAAIEEQRNAPLMLNNDSVELADFTDFERPERSLQPAGLTLAAEREAPRAAMPIETDAELAQLCLRDPRELTEGRARILQEVMSRRNGRELLRISGVDLDELDALLRSAA